MPRLCVFGCRPAKGVTFHVFPNPKRCAEQFKMWIDVIGGKLESPSDYEYYRKKKVVCDRHFTKSDHNRYNRLNALAVPSLNLHGCSFNVNKFAARTTPLLNDLNISMSTASEQRCLGNNLSIVKIESDQSPETSLSNELELDKYVPSEPSDLGSTLDIVKIDLEELSTQNDIKIRLDTEIDKSMGPEPYVLNPVCDVPKTFDNTRKTGFPFEHNYCRRSDQPPKPRKITRDLTPMFIAKQMSVMRKTIKNLRSEVCRLRNRVKTYKIKLANAKRKCDVGTPKRRTKVMSEKTKFTGKYSRLADTVLPVNRIVRIKNAAGINTYSRNKIPTINPKIIVLQNEC